MSMVKTVVSAARGCGHRKPGGFYLVSEVSANGVLPAWVPINPPIPVSTPFHRGPVVVDGAAILRRLPEDQWLAGSSAARAEKLKGEAWEREQFGMSATMRLRLGEGRGLRDSEQVLSHLLKTVAWSVRILVQIRDLSLLNVVELPRITPVFSELVKSAQQYDSEHDSRHLVSVAARVWEMAEALPPSHRKDVIPVLARVLALMNLRKDAVDLQRRYLL